MNKYTKRSWATIDLDAARHNYRVIRRIVNPSAKIMAVIKADGYGHGSIMLAREYVEEGVDWFAVSNIHEALELREAGFSLPILILGYTPPACAPDLAKYNICQAVYSVEYANALSKEALAHHVQIQIHVKIDTGMTRIGFYYHDIQRDTQTLEDVEAVCRNPAFLPDGIFTHFAVADEGTKGEAYTRQQFTLFTHLIEQLEQRGIHFANRHCCNSAGIIAYPEMHLDMVRPGIILYGLSPSSILRGSIDLKPVMQLNSIVSRVKEVDAGVDLSYGRTFTTRRPSRVATVPIGYADGYPRLLSSKGEMLVNGKRAKIMGRVCMDQLMLDVTEIEDVQEGTPVVCFGGTGENSLPLDELADAIGTINYELTCIVSKRIPRVYSKGGKIVACCEFEPRFTYEEGE